MPSFRTLARLAAALLAAAAAPAMAAQLTVDIPGCSSVALTGAGPTYSITCTQQTQTCAVNASPTNPQGNTTATLTVACQPAATSVTWQASRDCSTPTVSGAGPLVATVIEPGGLSCVYTAVANGGGSGSATVVWQGPGTQPPANAPSGCSVTRTPASGSLGAAGGAISLSGACTGGGAVTSRTWRKNATPNWSTAAAPTDTLPANSGTAAVTYTYGMTACAGTACAAEVVTTFTVAGSAPAGFCSQYNDVQFINLVWGGLVDTVGTSATIIPDRVVVGVLAVPAGVTSPLDIPGVISIVEFQGPTANRVMSISPQPCDFRGWTPGGSFPPQDQSGTTAPMAWDNNINPNRQFLLAGDPPGMFPVKPLFTPGQTYYVNLKSVFNVAGEPTSCTTGSCDVRITVNTPR